MTAELSLTRSWTPSGVVNWRDLVGTPTSDGRAVRAGRLFRSDTLQDLGAADVNVLTGALGVRTVLDLRYENEARAEGSGLLGEAPVAHYLLPFVGDQGQQPRHTLLPGAAEHLVRWYLSILSTSASRVASAVGLLADPHQLPAVVHCAAGKDRTGVLVGLVLSSIGVPDEVVADDYARSEDALTAILERLAGMPSYAADASGLHPDRNRTHPDTMIGFLAGVRARYGSVSGYLAGIGVGPAAQQQLAASLLEG